MSCHSLKSMIRLPELLSNLCFGGKAKHLLFITAASSVYSVTLNRKGGQLP